VGNCSPARSRRLRAQRARTATAATATTRATGIATKPGSRIGWGEKSPRLLRKKASSTVTLWRGPGSWRRMPKYQKKIWSNSGMLRTTST
jgi:hypothetical protein